MDLVSYVCGVIKRLDQMYLKKHFIGMEKGFYPSLTRMMDGQNRSQRRRSLSGHGKYKVGAMIVIGVTRFRYRLQIVRDKMTGVIKRIYHLDAKGSNW